MFIHKMQTEQIGEISLFSKVMRLSAVVKKYVDRNCNFEAFSFTRFCVLQSEFLSRSEVVAGHKAIRD